MGIRVRIALMGALALALGCDGSASSSDDECGSTVMETAQESLPEARATSDDIEVWTLFFPDWEMPAGQRPFVPVGRDIKIVFRSTGEGEVVLEAAGPNGERVLPAWGPQPHDGSNWDRPGDEWGSGWMIPKGGCWVIQLDRGDDRAALSIDAYA